MRDEIDIYDFPFFSLSTIVESDRVFLLFDYRLTSISCLRPSKSVLAMRAKYPRRERKQHKSRDRLQSELSYCTCGHAKVKRREREDSARGEVIKNGETESEQYGKGWRERALVIRAIPADKL